ncbi:MAG: alpha amylase C-terminal domain-containing protein [Akkermansiaceae bacterium]
MKELALIKEDPWLAPYGDEIQKRASNSAEFIARHGGSLLPLAQLHKRRGLHRADDGGWVFRDWLPRAEAVSLVGDFNGWDSSKHPATRSEDGEWEVTLPADCGLAHGAEFKVHVVGANGSHDRLSPYTRYAVQDEKTYAFSSCVWEPETPYAWKNKQPNKPAAPRIYECHIGMGTERQGVGTYEEFRTILLPRIAKLGYNTVQMMAIAEHPYYGSFGYHVANFFAPSSRFGTPDELKALIDEAHGLGVTVLMDLVHSHTVKNFAEGLREYDGQDRFLLHQHDHPQWDSLLFDYGREETRGFLLSNLAYWLEEFQFDGFRFDGVTSMLYDDHGDRAFDHYNLYFKDGVAEDAVLYLQLANHLIREINPEALTIAEDFSGMPGLCRALEDGGIGFDYRLGMGVPDFWIKLLKHKRDEEWNMSEIWSELSNRRAGEKTVAYAESHDQALVGDKTLAFWLMDKEMYWHMKADDPHPVIDRGMALHKMIRLLTMVSGGEAWLNFMGNEFGHPEWVDFPREGNDWSYQYARRQWSLADNPDLKYAGLQEFEKAILSLAGDYKLLESAPAQILNLDEGNRCLQFERSNLLFAFNFNATESIADYKFPAHTAGVYRSVLTSDAKEFGGHGRIKCGTEHHTLDGQVSIYLPARSAVVLVKQSD